MFSELKAYVPLSPPPKKNKNKSMEMCVEFFFFFILLSINFSCHRSKIKKHIFWLPSQLNKLFFPLNIRVIF